MSEDLPKAELIEGWMAVDRWWEEVAERRHYVVLDLRLASGPKQAVVCYDEKADIWTIKREEA